MRYFPSPRTEPGAHSPEPGSCSLPQLCPVTNSNSLELFIQVKKKYLFSKEHINKKTCFNQTA